MENSKTYTFFAKAITGICVIFSIFFIAICDSLIDNVPAFISYIVGLVFGWTIVSGMWKNINEKR